MNDTDTKRELKRLLLDADILRLKAEALCAGRQVRILSDYNGQPWGHSRKSLRGQVFTVERVGQVDPQWGVNLFLKGERLSINSNEVEWL